MNRRSIDVDGLGHANLPIPNASRVGPFIATGGIRGVDRTNRIMPDDPQAQADLMFDNLEAVMTAAGASMGDILKLTIWLRHDRFRPIVNAGWLRHFPDAASRPARHILIYDLPGEMVVQCEALAIASE